MMRSKRLTSVCRATSKKCLLLLAALPATILWCFVFAMDGY